MFLDGKTRQPVEGIIGRKFKCQFACVSKLSLIFFRQTIYHCLCLDRTCDDIRRLCSCSLFRSSSRFTFNFNPLQFNHRFNWSTVYSSGSLSNSNPGTPSLFVTTVKHSGTLFPIRIISPYFYYRIGLCLSESRRGLKFS